MNYIYFQTLSQPKEYPKGWKPTRVNAPARPGPKKYPAIVPCHKHQPTSADIRAIWESKTIAALMAKDG
jgi:hypothetical protein